MRLKHIEDVRERKRLYAAKVARRKPKQRKRPALGHFASLGGGYPSIAALVRKRED